MASHGDGSFYDDPLVHSRYVEHREGEQHLNPNHVMEEPAVLSEVGDPAGLRIMELGCGNAVFGRQLLAAGAESYTGVDNSRLMIDMARQNLTGTTGTARLGAIEDITIPSCSADLITSRLALHYVADLDGVLGIAARGLAPAGRLIFTVVHPVITSHDNRPAGPRTTWTVDDYFATGPRQRAWLGSEVTWHHRTIEDYVRGVTRAGLALTRLRECEPDPSRFGGHEGELARRRRLPLFLLISAVVV